MQNFLGTKQGPNQISSRTHFFGNSSENPYSHLANFEQTCSCLKIKGMADETLRWKHFPFSLTGRAKKWYNRHVGNSQGDWDIL